MIPWNEWQALAREHNIPIGIFEKDRAARLVHFGCYVRQNLLDKIVKICTPFSFVKKKIGSHVWNSFHRRLCSTG